MFKKSLVAAAGAALALSLAACGESADESKSAGANDPETLVVAAVPSEQSQSLKEQYELVIKVLEKETGKKVEFQNATDYAAVIEGQRAGKIHIAGYGPFSYMTAKDGGVDIVPLSAVVEKSGDKPGYQSYGITKSGSPIKTLADFKGKKVCFVDQKSTSGYLYPTAGLKEAGIDPEKDITPVFAGGHDASALAVAKGDCDAGFAFDTIVDKTLIEKGQLKAGDLTTVWKSETIAGSPFAVSNKLSKDLVAKITDAFQNKMNTDAAKSAGLCTDKCAWPEKKAFGMVKVDDKLYDGVRKVCQITQAKACKV